MEPYFYACICVVGWLQKLKIIYKHTIIISYNNVSYSRTSIFWHFRRHSNNTKQLITFQSSIIYYIQCQVNCCTVSRKYDSIVSIIINLFLIICTMISYRIPTLHFTLWLIIILHRQIKGYNMSKTTITCQEGNYRTMVLCNLLTHFIKYLEHRHFVCMKI